MFMSDYWDFGNRGRQVRTHCLPKGEEDNEFDSNNFEEGSVFGKITVELVEELDQAEHGHGDTGTFD